MGYGDTTSAATETLITQIMDAAFAVHRAVGPGLLESVYESCLFYELTKRGLKVRRQVALPIQYGDIRLDGGLVLDMLVEDSIILELKAVEKHHPLHQAQLLTYLKLAHKKVGLLINFNVPLLKDGFKRVLLKCLSSCRRVVVVNGSRGIV